ncbi:MAG: hypothetical protein OEQ18_13385 [Gammaproteobacteria bacterium]|nr:hypothetical protein [Gammaproteobacteria bacterium]
MRNHGVTCPGCRNQARHMYRRWDEMITHGTASQWLLLALIGLGLLAGPWGYLVAAGSGLTLALTTRRAPKKYYCDACGHGFFRPEMNPRPTPASTAQASPGQ